MSNILKAIEKEKEYLAYRMEGKEPFHLVDAVKECGFASLGDYFKEKKRHELSQRRFTLTECKQSEIVSEAIRILTNKLTGVWFADSDKTAVFNGDAGNETFNIQYCIDNAITAYSLLTGGGTIVHQAGDFSWGMACFENEAFSAEFLLEGVKDIFQKYTEKTVIVDGNDIMVDGEKVCGSTTYHKNGIFLFISYYSFNDKSELIKAICRKLSAKTPGYIDFMSREEFKQEVKSWLNL